MRRRFRISRAGAEQLLGTGAGGPEQLAALLAAATPPPALGELVGERAALREFRAAHLPTVQTPRRKRVLKPVLANLAAAKVALSVVAAAAVTGGVALAAVSGTLPGTSQGGAHSSHIPPSPVSESARPSEAPGTKAAVPSSKQRDREAPNGSATPSPSLSGLCKAFQAGATDNPGKALHTPAFSVLVSAAGGADKVSDYCATVVDEAPAHQTGAPESHPSAPVAHPTGRPASPPAAPATHPTGAPATPGRP